METLGIIVTVIAITYLIGFAGVLVWAVISASIYGHGFNNTLSYALAWPIVVYAIIQMMIRHNR